MLFLNNITVHLSGFVPTFIPLTNSGASFGLQVEAMQRPLRWVWPLDVRITSLWEAHVHKQRRWHRHLYGRLLKTLLSGKSFNCFFAFPPLSEALVLMSVVRDRIHAQRDVDTCGSLTVHVVALGDCLWSRFLSPISLPSLSRWIGYLNNVKSLDQAKGFLGVSKEDPGSQCILFP